MFDGINSDNDCVDIKQMMWNNQMLGGIPERIKINLTSQTSSYFRIKQVDLSTILFGENWQALTFTIR